MSEDQDGPIEIELTSHAPKRGRGRRDTTAAAPSTTPPPSPPGPVRGDAAVDTPLSPEPGAGPESGWLGSERSRLLVSVSAAAVIALLMGWMLGRTGGESTAAGDDAPVATAPVETTEPEDDEVDPAFEAAEELPDADVDLDDLFAPETTAPPPTTAPLVVAEVGGDESADEPEPEAIEIAFDERALGRDLTLITVDGQRRLLEIDLSTGAVTQRGEPLSSVADGVFGGSDWIGVAAEGSSRVFIDRDDGTRNAIDGIPWWTLAVDTERDVLWSTGVDFGPDITEFVERDLDGEPTGRTIAIPTDGWAAIFDGGAFLTTAVGTVYRIDPDGHEAITSGQILAASPNTLVLQDCDEELRCGLRIVDRSSGDSRWLPPGPAQVAQRYFPLQWYFGNRAASPFSPDDRWMLVVAPTEFAQDVGLVDLTTGEFIRVEAIGSEGFDVSWTWAPDGRSAFFTQGRVPWLYDVETGESFRLSEDRLTWSAMLVRENDAG